MSYSPFEDSQEYHDSVAGRAKLTEPAIHINQQPQPKMPSRRSECPVASGCMYHTSGECGKRWLQ